MGRARANSDIASVERVGSGLTELSKSPGPYEVLITPLGSSRLILASAWHLHPSGSRQEELGGARRSQEKLMSKEELGGARRSQ